MPAGIRQLPPFDSNDRDLDFQLNSLIRQMQADDWQDVATGVGFQNSWVNFNPTFFQAASYMIDFMGFVHIRGFIKDGNVDSTIFTLPAGFRPNHSIISGMIMNNATNDVLVRIDIQGGGLVNQVNGTGSNTWLTLNAIFKAAQ